MNAREKGIFHKFNVTRTDGRDAPGEKHEGDQYFVLNITTDPYAIPALVADALAPDGIPGEMLAEALGPISDRLAMSSNTSEWLRIGIDKDMAITAEGGRAYALLSESEKWRADAMIAEAVAFLSGIRLLVLDRFDVLDLKGREDLLYWLDAMAEDGEIDTALVFGTLKALPAQLPETVGAYWIDNGVAGQMKEAA